MDAIVFMNTEVKTEELSTVLDMTMSLVVENPRRPLKEVIPVIIESAFSQHMDPLMTKLRKQILAKLEVLMIIAALIKETKVYQSSGKLSTTWNTLL